MWVGVGGALFCVGGAEWGCVAVGGGEWGLVHCLIMPMYIIVPPVVDSVGVYISKVKILKIDVFSNF